VTDLILPASLAVWDPLGGTQEPVMTGHDGVCVHTMAGTFVGTDGYFHQDGWQGTESTVGVAGSGFCKQWVPWNRQADANLEGNRRWLSIECADKGEGFPAGEHGNDGPPLTAAQIDRIVALCRYWCSVEAHRNCPTGWTCHREGIPRRFVNSSCERGIGVHRHGIDPWRKSGCPHWSSSAGKICPRTVRLDQVRNIIVPRVALGTQEEDMTPDQAKQLAEIHKASKDIGAVKFLVGLLWDLNVPNGFRYVDPTTGELTSKDTPGAKPVTDVWRWAREAAIQAREEPDQHAAIEELVEQLRDLHVPSEPA
jgi:hypothetical protein